MPPVKNSKGSAAVYTAKILDVNIAQYSVSVASQFLPNPLTDIAFAVPYMHSYNGEGIYFMPEVGSVCWVCEPSDGNMPFVLAWGAPEVEGTDKFRAHRQDLNPGDIWMGTRDENFLILRRGGVVQIGGTGLCQRMFLPINNTIKDYCENYGLHTLGGDLEWTIARPESTTDGHRPALLTLNAREFADDPHPIASLEIGSHGDNDPTILSLTIKASGADGAADKISLKIDKEGNVTWEVKKDVVWKIEGKLTVEVGKEADFKFKDALTAQISKTMKLTVDQAVEIVTQATMKLQASKVTIKDKLDVGSATNPVVMATQMFETWVKGHLHPTTSPGAPTGPPTAGPPAGPIAASDLKTS